MNTTPPLRLRRLATLAVALTPFVGFSQSAAPAANPAPAAPPETIQLDPFTVTEQNDGGYGAQYSISGTRVNIAISDLPRNLSVVTSEFMRDIDAYNQGELLEFTSSVTRTPTGRDNDAITIRGFEVGAPYRNFFRYRAPVWAVNVDRVEIIKGPASTLYGVAGPGGQVNYVTKRPQFARKGTFDFGVGVENHEYIRGVGDYQDVAGSKGQLGYRLVAGYEDGDGPTNRTPATRRHVSLSTRWNRAPAESLIFEYEFNRAAVVPVGGTPKAEVSGPQSTLEQRFNGRFIPKVRWFTPTQEVDQLFFDVFLMDPKFTFNNTFDTSETTSHLFTTEYRRPVFKRVNLNLAYLFNRLRSDQMDSVNEQIKGQLQDPKVAFSPPSDQLRTDHIRSDAVWDPFSGVVSQSARNTREDTDNHSVQLTLTGDFETGFLKHQVLVGGSFDRDRISQREYETNGVKLNNVLAWRDINWREVVGRENSDVLRLFPVLDADGNQSYNTFFIPGRGIFRTPIYETTPRAVPLRWEDRLDLQQTFTDTAAWLVMTTPAWDGRVRLVYGARHDELTLDNQSIVTSRFGARSVNDSEQTQRSVTPQAAGLWKIFSWLSLYGSYSESVNPQFGIYRDEFADPSTARGRPPLEGRSAEAGFKFSLFNKRIEGTIAAFDAERTNRVVNAGTDRFGQWQRVITAESAKGIETDVLFSLTRGWQIVLGGEYTDAIQNAPRSAEPNFDFTRRAPNISDWQWRAFTKYSFRSGPFKGLSIGGGANYASDKTWRQSDRPERVRDSQAQEWTVYRLFASYSWRMFDHAWSLRANVRNLTEEEYFLSASQLGPPRETRLALSVQF